MEKWVYICPETGPKGNPQNLTSDLPCNTEMKPKSNMIN